MNRRLCMQIVLLVVFFCDGSMVGKELPSAKLPLAAPVMGDGNEPGRLSHLKDEEFPEKHYILARSADEDYDVYLYLPSTQAKAHEKLAVASNKEPLVVRPGDKLEVLVKKKEAAPKKNAKAEQKDEKNTSPKKECIVVRPGDSELKFEVRLRLPEFFYGKNLRFLNNDNPTDRVIYFRHIVDLITQYRYGQPKCPYDIVYAKMTIRNKGVWGDPESIASTTSAGVNEFGAFFGDHGHGIPLHFLWIRELWIQLALNDLLHLPFSHQHTLTFGAFPFELGRGISLGVAYALDASDLGFISEYAVDQFAFGGKLSGELCKGTLFYDLYGAILDNKAASFGQTNAKFRGQQYFHRNDQARGFGIINYIIAARLKLHAAWRNKPSASRIEPYILYNHNPEQRVEFKGDAKSDLVTVGIAAENDWGRFEWGFDTAYNFGKQKVHGWDRNVIRPENRNGAAVIVNSRVRQAPPGADPSQKSPLALNVPENQAIIDVSPETQLENGKIIGVNSLGTLINDRDRFSDGYENKFRGSMFVFDMGYLVCKPDLKLCAGFGYASGGPNPNRDHIKRGDHIRNEVYEGFIGLQEVYSGTRVKSAFLLSGQGRIPRPLAFPSEDVRHQFATVVSRFTNLVYVGSSAMYRPSWSIRKWSFNPNILAFWNDFATPFHDAKTHLKSISRFARNFLGVELNMFIEGELLPDLKFYSVNALFFPGSHYKDIKGRPLNKAQKDFIDNLGKPGIINDRVPLLGNDTSYFFNLGLQYSF